MRKVLLTMLATAGVAGSFGVVAPSASADIQRCSGVVSLAPLDADLQSCIFVDPTTGRATGLLHFGSGVGRADGTLTVTIQRSGSHATKSCTIHYVTGGPQPAPCAAFAGNPAGEQAWRADSAFFGMTVMSPTIFDT